MIVYDQICPYLNCYASLKLKDIEDAIQVLEKSTVEFLEENCKKVASGEENMA
jgi:hypothetical protein